MRVSTILDHIDDGGAALLETALQMASVKPANTVRFAWWGAEESGLLGSEHYVAGLTPAEAARIALYLNFDMVASPNYIFGVYDGDNSSGTAPVSIPAGSDKIEDVFERYYAGRGEPYQDSTFSGGSDYGPSSRSASRPADCSPAQRASRRPRRSRPTAAPRASRTTPATTKPATR